ncbi:hypothetical protein FACS1894179_09760 [Bacteroidia bacterium]|nr:hypothetical protein FACS1894179_09760 [Bacteroidia bacterium]
MSGNDTRKCPLCGKNTTGEEVFCRDCQEIAQDSYSEEFLVREYNEDIQEQEEIISSPEMLEKEPDVYDEKSLSVDKGNKKGRFFLVAGLILILLIGGAGTYYYLQDKKAKETEVSYWNQCIDENTPQGYSKYLLQYPDGRFGEEARSKIVELHEKEQKEWEKLRETNDVDALFSFLTDHPETPYVREIRHSIDSLSWLKTISDNTADSYLAYLENIKIGRFAGEYQTKAQERYDYLSQLRPVEGEELTRIKKEIAGFFKSLSDTNEKDLAKRMLPTLAEFYDAQNQSSKNIIESIKSEFKKNKIRSISYTPVADSIEAIVDNKGIYFITLPVKEEKNYTDQKKKKEISEYVLNLEIDNNKRLQTVYKK